MKITKDVGKTKGSLNQTNLTIGVGRNYKPSLISIKVKSSIDERSNSRPPTTKRKDNESNVKVKKNSDYFPIEKKGQGVQGYSNGLVSKTRQLIRELKPLSTQFGKSSTLTKSSTKTSKATKNIGLSETLKQTNNAEVGALSAKIKQINFSTINTTNSNYSGANTSKTPSSKTSNQKHFFSNNTKLKEPVSTKNKGAKPFSAIFNSFEISKEAMSFDVENNSCDYFNTIYSQIIHEKEKEVSGCQIKDVNSKPKRNSMEPIKSLKNTVGLKSTVVGKSINSTSNTIKVVRQSKMVFKPNS